MPLTPKTVTPAMATTTTTTTTASLPTSIPTATATAPALHPARAPQPVPYKQPVSPATVAAELIPRLQIHTWQTFFRVFVSSLSRYLHAHRGFFDDTGRSQRHSFRAAITDFDLTLLHAHATNLAGAEAAIASIAAGGAAPMDAEWVRRDMEIVRGPLERLVEALAEMVKGAGNVGSDVDALRAHREDLWLSFYAAALTEQDYYHFLLASHGMHAVALSYAASGRAVRCALSTAVDAELESVADLETPLWAVLREFLACAGVRARWGQHCRCLQTVVLS